MTPERRDITLASGHRLATYTAKPAGARKDKTLLLINGGPGLPCDYLLTPHLALVEQGWTVVSYDQLGCGEWQRGRNQSRAPRVFQAHGA